MTNNYGLYCAKKLPECKCATDRFADARFINFQLKKKQSTHKQF